MDRECLSGFHVPEADRPVGKVEAALGGTVQHVEHQHFVSAVTEMLQCLNEGVVLILTVLLVCKQITDENDEPATWKPLGDGVQGMSRIRSFGLGTGRRRVGQVLESPKEDLEMVPRGSRRDEGPNLAVKGDEAGGVSLLDHQRVESGRQRGPVVQLCYRRVAAIAHRVAGVKHDHLPEVRLLLIALHVKPVFSPHHFPVYVAEVVAGVVLPMFCKLDGKAVVGTSMHSRNEALDNEPGTELHRVDSGEVVGAEKGHATEG